LLEAIGARARILWPSIQDWLSALFIILPAYCTNGAPVIFGGGLPIDMGKKLWDGERVLGDNKTVRGFAGGLAAGILVGILSSYAFSRNLLTIAVLASLGALLGDLAGAFLKRRLKIKPGSSLPAVDQLDFVVGALVFVSLYSAISLPVVLILLLVTPPIHFLTNVGAYLLGLKEHYW
jgi:CDP-2,3-bis-(O-geranylgeranyl)-sn-glycerol synthase